MINNNLLLDVMTLQRVNVMEDMKQDPGQPDWGGEQQLTGKASKPSHTENQGCGLPVPPVPLNWLVWLCLSFFSSVPVTGQSVKQNQ